MFSEDFVMRMIRMATATMVQLLGLKKAGEFTQAQELIDGQLEQLLGLKAQFVKQMDEDSIIAALTKQDQFDIDRAIIIADFFVVEGEIFETRGLNNESRQDYLKSLRLYIEAKLTTGPGFSDGVQKKIYNLIDKIGSETLPVDLAYLYFIFLEQDGSFQEADRVIMELIGQSGNDPSLWEAQREFYQRLLSNNDEVLRQGKISRQEIVDKLEKSGWQEAIRRSYRFSDLLNPAGRAKSNGLT